MLRSVRNSLASVMPVAGIVYLAYGTFTGYPMAMYLAFVGFSVSTFGGIVHYLTEDTTNVNQ